MSIQLRSITILFYMMTTVSLAAATPDSVQTEHRSVWQLLDTDTWKNPALHGQAFRTDYTQLTLNLDYTEQTEAFVLQKGTGSTLYEMEANTYLHLSNHSTVWGKASYMTGRSRHITWSSVSDYELLEPYILADTMGGNTERERYVFEGGYATRLNRLLLGGEMLFRAEHEYRTTDPRMRAIVTDLTLRAGAAYETNTYHWGAAAEANIYKQTDNVAFYRETGVIPEFQMTGLGAVYVRFSGEVNNLYFNGGGAQLYLNAQPTDGRGLFANITVGEHRYERIAASLNSLPLTKLYREEAKLQTGWRKDGKTHWAVYADAHYTRRLGDENMVGSSLSNNYPILTTLTMYKNTLIDASLNVVYGQRRHTDWHIALKAGYTENKETYVEPERRQETRRLYGRLGAQHIAAIGHKGVLTCALTATCLRNLDSRLSIPVLNTEVAAVKMLNHNYRYLKADYTVVDAQVRYDHAIGAGRMALFGILGGGVTFCSEGEQEQHLTMTLGISF